MKNRKKKKRVYLTRRDRRILEFVDVYRIATAALLAIALFGGESQEDAASRVLRKLTRRGYLRRVTITHGRSYVVMTRRGCRATGAPDRTPRPLTEQSLPVVLATAWFCVRHGLSRMTDRELRNRFPELWRPGLKSSCYCLRETREGRKLIMFLVDRGGAARRIRTRIRRVVAQRRSLPGFASLMAARRVQVSVLTGNALQEQNIRRQLDHVQDQPVDVEIAVVPEIADLLTLDIAR